MKPFDNEDDQDLADLLFGTNLSVTEIAQELYLPESHVRQRIKELGLGWVRRRQGHASRGQAALTAMLHKLLPGEQVISEHPIGERLTLDVYCPKYRLAVEYHGRQHFEFVEHFHRDIYGFQQSQERDERKLQLCLDRGIVVVVFRYNDELTENVVFSRLLHALETAPPRVEPVKGSQFKGNPYYEAYKKRQREYRQRTYRKMKDGWKR